MCSCLLSLSSTFLRLRVDLPGEFCRGKFPVSCPLVILEHAEGRLPGPGAGFRPVFFTRLTPLFFRRSFSVSRWCSLRWVFTQGNVRLPVRSRGARLLGRETGGCTLPRMRCRMALLLFFRVGRCRRGTGGCGREKRSPSFRGEILCRMRDYWPGPGSWRSCSVLLACLSPGSPCAGFVRCVVPTVGAFVGSVRALFKGRDPPCGGVKRGLSLDGWPGLSMTFMDSCFSIVEFIYGMYPPCFVSGCCRGEYARHDLFLCQASCACEGGPCGRGCVWGASVFTSSGWSFLAART